MTTAKAKLHLIMTKMGEKCRYETWQLAHSETGHVDSEEHNEMGLFEFNKEDPMFTCKLHLPDGSIVRSSSFRRKKDAEQDAALLALLKMGIPYQPGVLQATMKELWDGLLHKVCLAFADQMVLSYKPLAEHFRVAVQRDGSRFGQVPAIVMTVLDAKITSQCKSINQLAESNPAYAAALVCRAAAACPTLRLSDDGLWIGRSDPLSAEVTTKLLYGEENQEGSASSDDCSELKSVEATQSWIVSASNGSRQYTAVYIPACPEKELRTIYLNTSSDIYYMDAIAQKLDVPDAGHVILSRHIGKAPDGSRMYWALKERLPRVDIPGAEHIDTSKICYEPCPKDGPMEPLRNPRRLILRNERASFLVGHAIDGDAILATVGSTWASEGRCIYDDFTLSSFHRLMLGRTPWGAFKLSRQSLLVAELPKVYTCRAHWHGASPKSLLADFCHQHRLPEAHYACNSSLELSNEISAEDYLEYDGEHSRNFTSLNDKPCTKNHTPGSGRQGPFHCRVVVGNANKVYFDSDGYFRSRHDAVQSAALNAVLNYSRWSGTACLYSYFQNQDCCQSGVASLNTVTNDSTLYKSDESNGHFKELCPTFEVVAEEAILGDRPPPGAMVCVSYSVNLVKEGFSCKGNSSSGSTSQHSLEAQLDFKFELSVGAVIAPFDACVSQALVGQTLRFSTPAEALGVTFAASNSLGEHQQGWVLEYTVKLLKFEEALEERIESSHFSPPLSKQRIEYARILINALEAKTLVDLGCGSGSLLEALLKETNTLEHMIGIDTSRKALIRAAKTLSATLIKQNEPHGIHSVTLYEGTISEMDPGLCSPDLATCIEVVEHMDPEPLYRLGESVLGKLVPKIWLVSTPNIEYNPIIRGLDWDPGSNSLSKVSQKVFPEPAEIKKITDVETPNLRNHDHRFEWTRAEFRDWASQLAAQYGYQVSFAGVGGDGEDDINSPGFATQIAVFAHNAVIFPRMCDSVDQYRESRHMPRANEVDDIMDHSKGHGDSISPFNELWRWTSTAHSLEVK